MPIDFDPGSLVDGLGVDSVVTRLNAFHGDDSVSGRRQGAHTDRKT